MAQPHPFFVAFSWTKEVWKRFFPPEVEEKADFETKSWIIRDLAVIECFHAIVL